MLSSVSPWEHRYFQAMIPKMLGFCPLQVPTFSRTLPFSVGPQAQVSTDHVWQHTIEGLSTRCSQESKGPVPDKHTVVSAAGCYLPKPIPLPSIILGWAYFKVGQVPKTANCMTVLCKPLSDMQIYQIQFLLSASLRLLQVNSSSSFCYSHNVCQKFWKKKCTK